MGYQMVPPTACTNNTHWLPHGWRWEVHQHGRASEGVQGRAAEGNPSPVLVVPTSGMGHLPPLPQII